MKPLNQREYADVVIMLLIMTLFAVPIYLAFNHTNDIYKEDGYKCERIEKGDLE